MSIASLYPSINPSLLLDFANSKVLDPRITFTRTTTATYYDGVTTAKAEENLLLQSQFAASWSGFNATLTANTTTAPDGTSTAATVVENTANNQHVAYQQPTYTTSATYTFSCYFKAGTRNYGMLRDANNAIKIDLTNGTTTVIEGSPTSHSATSVGNGWYRCVMTLASINNNFQVGPHDNGSTTTYTGNGTGSVYVWGAQLEQRSSATAYTATTTQAITNYIPVLQTAAAGQARFDHNPTTGESLGLLIEEARTNSITYSSDFSNAAWTKLGVTITSNTIVAPDGTLTGDKVVPSVSQTYNQNYSSLTLLTGTNYAISCYAKKGEYSYLNLALIYNASNYAGAQFDLNAGSVLYTRASGFGYSVVSTSIAPVGNGWYRCVVVATSGLTGIYPNVVASNSLWTSGYPDIAITADGFSGVYIWGAQLETGSFATSYIPTVASSVTRNADAASMTGTNFSSWFNNGEGTVYFEAQPMYVGTGVSGLNAIAWDGSVNNLISAGQNGGMGQATAADFYIATNNVTQTYVSSTSISTSSAFKIVGAYEFNNSSAYLNAAIMGSLDTSCTIPVVNQLKIDGNLGYTNRANGWVRKLSYYPQRLSATNLAALTT